MSKRGNDCAEREYRIRKSWRRFCCDHLLGESFSEEKGPSRHRQIGRGKEVGPVCMEDIDRKRERRK